MSFDPKKTPGIGQLFLISMSPNEDFRSEHDKIFEEVDGLSRVYCAIQAELSDAYRIWSIYGSPYTSNITQMNSREQGVPADLLTLWSEVLILRTVRLTDKSKYDEPVSVVQFLELDLDADLKKEVDDLIKIAKDKTKPLRKARNKFIAHKDFDVVDHKISIQDPGFTIHDIADILESIGNILICIYNHYTGSKTYINFIVRQRVLDEIEY